MRVYTLHGQVFVMIKGIGSQTSTGILYEWLKLVEHFAANFIKINGDLRKLYDFKHFGGVVRPKQGCDDMTSLPHNHKIEIISHSQTNVSE